MAITNTEMLDDRVRVHYYCQRPWGDSDENGSVEILYTSIPSLPRAPALPQRYGESGTVWEETVQIPSHGLTISFHFAEWQETVACRMQALIGGPYLGKPKKAG